MHQTTESGDLYSECRQNDASQDEILQCVTEALQLAQDESNAGIYSFFLIYAASLVFFMQAGFAMLCAGSVRLKNVQNTMLKNLLDACGAALGFYTVGYAFAYGGSLDGGSKTFIGNTNFFMMDIDDFAFWLFQFAFAATSATIVAGTLAERCQMAAYLCYSVLLTGFVYPVIAHAIWSGRGFLSPTADDPLWGTGMVDFAGSGVVHTTGGITALIATYILGPRRGRFYNARGERLDKPKPFPGHSVALQVLGAFILWFGWYGFNSGSALATNSHVKGKIASLAAVNTTLAGAAGGVTALFTNLIKVERHTGEATFNLTFAMNGALAGLVAITGGCAVIEPWAAIVIGFVAGLLYLVGSHKLLRLQLDDAVDAIPVHLVNGIWGVIAVGLLAAPQRLEDVYNRSEHVGWFYSWGRGSGDATLLACQIVGLLFILGWVVCIFFPFFVWLNYVGWFRADSLEELVGLDISYHGGSVSNPDEVKLEYVEAFNMRKKEQSRHRKRNSHGSQSSHTHYSHGSHGNIATEVIDSEPSAGVDRVEPCSELEPQPC